MRKKIRRPVKREAVTLHLTETEIRDPVELSIVTRVIWSIF